MNGRDAAVPPDLASAAEGGWLGEAIAARAERGGLHLAPGAVEALVAHVRLIAVRNERAHLTSILDPAEFLERHLGESLEGAALLAGDVEGTLVDLGSGNGYPGLPVAAARPGLRPVLVDASARKAAFLREVVAEAFPGAAVLERQVQRAADLEGIDAVRVLVTRAAGPWERVVPRLARAMAPGGRVLLWAGGETEQIARREAWSRYRLLERHPLPGRDRSWIWSFETR